MPSHPTAVRFATFNTSLNRTAAGDLIGDLSSTDNPQARAVAEIIQRINPDVLLINEFDHDLAARAATLLQRNYLAIPQNGANPLDYPYMFLAPVNTGVPSGFDLNRDGRAEGPEDALGYGFFPGQFGMLLLSRYPIYRAGVRTFQNFLWKTMPAALLPDDPHSGAPGGYYSPAALAVLPLSSKSHWDVPIRIGENLVHILASHPTPPVFDGPEQRNRRRNHDEIRFWVDYVSPGAGEYIRDDNGGLGGLGEASFVIMGDQNADPCKGRSLRNAALQLIGLERLNTRITPTSRYSGAGTADFRDGEASPGVLRVDYVLPSADLQIIDAGVFWPAPDEALGRLVGRDAGGRPSSSDHRLVWVDVRLERWSCRVV